MVVEDDGHGIGEQELLVLRERLGHSREDDQTYSGHLGLINLNTPASVCLWGVRRAHGGAGRFRRAACGAVLPLSSV
jgi:hypothetical protein